MEILVICCFIIAGGLIFWKTRKKKNDVEKSYKTKISYLPIQKSEIVKQDVGAFELDIVSLTENQERFEVVVNFKNNQQKSVRIDVKEIELSHQGKVYKGDSSIYELNMGTNDAILKNTIISNGNLLKNILFQDIKADNISEKDAIKIVFEENNLTYKLTQTINASSVTEIKVIEIEEI